MLLKSCLRWTGHVIRMEDHRIPKQLLFGELEQGHRRQGRPCKRFKDTVKAGLKRCGIPTTQLVATALDRQRWRTLTQSASSALEKERRHQAQSARERRYNSLYPSDKCELPLPSLRTALYVQDRPAESLPYPEIGGTDNVILETDGPPLYCINCKPHSFKLYTNTISCLTLFSYMNTAILHSRKLRQSTSAVHKSSPFYSVLFLQFPTRLAQQMSTLTFAAVCTQRQRPVYIYLNSQSNRHPFRCTYI